MRAVDDVVFLFDVDNTLLDNDWIQADLSDHLVAKFGADARDRYWAIFERLRDELGYADYLGALERYRLEDLHDPRVLTMSTWLIDYPFGDRLYPAALDAKDARATPAADVVIERIGDLVALDRAAFTPASDGDGARQAGRSGTGE